MTVNLQLKSNNVPDLIIQEERDFETEENVSKQILELTNQ